MIAARITLTTFLTVFFIGFPLSGYHLAAYAAILRILYLTRKNLYMQEGNITKNKNSTGS
jgi:hypothetical protein